ncbi:MAG: YciI family protein [Actinomycetota bacterium]|nr:YciI family protein [Actinomycetota bacterium]
MADYLLIYTYVEGMAEKRTPHRDVHLAHVAVQRESGHITSAGAFEPPSGAALVFMDVERDDIEAFVGADPYNTAGLIADWRIERWNVG